MNADDKTIIAIASNNDGLAEKNDVWAKIMFDDKTDFQFLVAEKIAQGENVRPQIKNVPNKTAANVYFWWKEGNNNDTKFFRYIFFPRDSKNLTPQNGKAWDAIIITWENITIVIDDKKTKKITKTVYHGSDGGIGNIGEEGDLKRILNRLNKKN